MTPSDLAAATSGIVPYWEFAMLTDRGRVRENNEDAVAVDPVLGLAILADGGRSGLREQLGIGVRQRTYDQSALIANISPSQPHLGQAFERFTEEGPMALLPLPDNRCALVWTQLGLGAQRLAGLDERAFLGQLQDAFGYRLGSLRQVGALGCRAQAAITSSLL